MDGRHLTEQAENSMESKTLITLSLKCKKGTVYVIIKGPHGKVFHRVKSFSSSFMKMFISTCCLYLQWGHSHLNIAPHLCMFPSQNCCRRAQLSREGGREGDARGKRYGNICICITDSLCYKAETNTPL